MYQYAWQWKDEWAAREVTISSKVHRERVENPETASDPKRYV